ncbi:MAG: bifunctional 2-C-methyl-D-erythritol 4-phosphate cytidylyltransferase/2-C-methyl-D-erythritol 2,4-cyclodiphosphate synthase [Sphingomonadaceae bacterium]
MAAGSGVRSGEGAPKQYRPIGGKAMIAHALDRLRAAGIGTVQPVIGEGQRELFEAALDGRETLAPVIGGATRQASVRKGLDALAAAGDTQTVFIHDAARPFLPPPVKQRLAAALERHDGAVPALAVVDSLARSDKRLGEPVPREGLLRVQTPQAFRFEAILDAHRRWTGAEDATDDAQVARAAGIEVATVVGDEALMKITHEGDFARAEAMLAARMITRTGLGFDVHALAAGRELWLGGTRIDHARGLAGHSDADVVLHALADALLGAIGAGDIGEHFPPGDPQWRGAASSRFVAHARALVEEAGGRIDHVDILLICEEPRIGPHKPAMRERIAALLGLPRSRVSLKATTTDGLGFTGRGEGIAAQALATLSMPEER